MGYALTGGFIIGGMFAYLAGVLAGIAAEGAAKGYADTVRILFATSNPHKLRELREMLVPLGIEVLGLTFWYTAVLTSIEK